MKKVYELIIDFQDETQSGLLFSKRVDALKERELKYLPGTETPFGKVTNSIVVSRIVF